MKYIHLFSYCHVSVIIPPQANVGRFLFFRKLVYLSLFGLNYWIHCGSVTHIKWNYYYLGWNMMAFWLFVFLRVRTRMVSSACTSCTWMDSLNRPQESSSFQRKKGSQLSPVALLLPLTKWVLDLSLFFSLSFILYSICLYLLLLGRIFCFGLPNIRVTRVIVPCHFCCVPCFRWQLWTAYKLWIHSRSMQLCPWSMGTVLTTTSWLQQDVLGWDPGPLKLI